MRYYAGIVDQDGQLMMTPAGPFDSCDDITAWHVREASMQSPQFNLTTGAIEQPKYNRRFLLDTGGGIANEAELNTLLTSDPFLRTLFELGRRMGARDVE
jgi:hypothetical protein